MEKVICSIFKVEKLKPYQIQSLEALYNGKDIFVCQPTGSGKSLVFFALPYYFLYMKKNRHVFQEDFELATVKSCEQRIIVVSPLLSLMKDQHEKLKSLGITSFWEDDHFPFSHTKKSKQKNKQKCRFKNFSFSTRDPLIEREIYKNSFIK